MKNLSGNHVSSVWVENGKIFKKQPKFMCENEVYALEALKNTGFVPDFRRLGDELIEMDYLVSTPVTDVDDLWDSANLFLGVLQQSNIRHGDLTSPHIFTINNGVRVIDWGESRDMYDPRPDKRPEGDRFWMTKTIQEKIDAAS